MDSLQKGLNNLRMQLIQRSEDIKRDAKLSDLVFGPLESDHFMVRAYWENRDKTTKDTSITFDRCSFLSITPRCAQLKDTYCGYADELVKEVKRERGLPFK